MSTRAVVARGAARMLTSLRLIRAAKGRRGLGGVVVSARAGTVVRAFHEHWFSTAEQDKAHGEGGAELKHKNGILTATGRRFIDEPCTWCWCHKCGLHWQNNAATTSGSHKSGLPLPQNVHVKYVVGRVSCLWRHYFKTFHNDSITCSYMYMYNHHACTETAVGADLRSFISYYRRAFDVATIHNTCWRYTNCHKPKIDAREYCIRQS